MAFPRVRALLPLLLVALAVALAACAEGETLPCHEPPETQLAVPQIVDEVRLVAFGDWGTGDKQQRRVACACDKAAAEISGFHAGLLLGDNFYPRGVTSRFDRRWQTDFENVYSTKHLGRMGWWAVLGNHDWLGNPEAQIEYSAHSTRFNMPAHYYRKDFGVQGQPPLLTVLAVDTEPQFGFWDEQVQWLEGELQALQGQGHAVVVIGHHPIVSNGTHGAAQPVEARLKPILENYAPIAYLCGHDHHLELNIENNVAYAVLGGGGKQKRPVGTGPFQQFARSSYGFGVIRATATRFTIEFRDDQARTMHIWSRAVP